MAKDEKAHSRLVDEPVSSKDFQNLSRFLRYPGFCRELVRSFPCIFYFSRRRHPALVGAASIEPLELSSTVRVFPHALDRDVLTGRFDLAFKRADLAVSVGAHVHDVAALPT